MNADWELLLGLQKALQAIKDAQDISLQDPLLENTFADTVSIFLQQQGYRTASRVNLWQRAADALREHDPVKILKTMKHPLQPDVDLLVEDPQDAHKLSGFEIKVIRWSPVSLRQVVPQPARLYTGLDQALSLTTYGLDYVCLWHIFAPSMVTHRKAYLEKGHTWAEQWDNARIEFTAAYSGIVSGILNNFRLPIGYLATGVFIGTDPTHPNERLGIADNLGGRRIPGLLRVEPTETGTRIRKLLQEALNTQPHQAMR